MSLIDALKTERARLAGELSKVDKAIRLFGGQVHGARRKGTMSAESRAKIAKAQKLRWAKVRAAAKKS